MTPSLPSRQLSTKGGNSNAINYFPPNRGPSSCISQKPHRKAGATNDSMQKNELQNTAYAGLPDEAM